MVVSTVIDSDGAWLNYELIGLAILALWVFAGHRHSPEFDRFRGSVDAWSLDDASGRPTQVEFGLQEMGTKYHVQCIRISATARAVVLIGAPACPSGLERYA